MGPLAFSTCLQSRVQTSANIQGENHTHECQRHPEESVNSKKHLVKKKSWRNLKGSWILKRETEEYQMGEIPCTMVSSTVSQMPSVLN